MQGLDDQPDTGWYDPFNPGNRAAVPLPHIWARVPDDIEQASRREAFRQDHPEVGLDRVGDRAQAVVPLPGGERVITRWTWREVLDELGAPDPGPG